MIELRYPAHLVTPQFSEWLRALADEEPDGWPGSTKHDVFLVLDALQPGQGRQTKWLRLDVQMTESAAYSLVVRGVDVRVLDDSTVDDVTS